MPVESIQVGAVSRGEANDAALIEQLRTVAELLEAVAGNRALLMGLSAGERLRLIQAAGDVYCPDPRARRRLVKATSRKRPGFS